MAQPRGTKRAKLNNCKETTVVAHPKVNRHSKEDIDESLNEAYTGDGLNSLK
jgi:hypothetical protein